MARLRLFGHPALETAESRNALGLSPKGVAVVALIAADAQRPLSRDWLACKVWANVDPADARANLRRQLHLAQKVLGDDAFLLTRETVQWNAEGHVSADVVAFDGLRATDPAAAAEQYAGELCAGIAEDAIDDVRIRYRAQYEGLLRSLLERAKDSGDERAARIWLERLIQHDPYDEDAVREMMLLRLKTGDRAGAIRDYNALRQRLLGEIGAEPQPETAALLAEGAAPDRAVPNNVPASTTSFVGREREIGEIETALRTSRMTTLVGAGGAGKSRLAARCCLRVLGSYRDGVWFADLEHAKNESDVWQLVGNAVRVPAAQSSEAGVLQHLQRRSCLIVLDTCEHVLAAAQRVADKLLSQTQVTILATSRRAMPVKGAHGVSIGALDAPSSRRLFLERATVVNPAFSLDKARENSLAHLLARVDGLPLAIELLASRANVLSIDGMRARLRQTLQSPIAETLTWSYELLLQPQRRLFASLAVFRSSFTLEDVDSIQSEDDRVPDGLRELVDASLVSEVAAGSGVRYRLLETTRDFAESRLRESSRFEDALVAHARHFAEKADALAAMPETDFPAVIETLGFAMPDYLAAFEYAASRGCGGIGVRLIEGLYKFGMRGLFTAQVRDHAAACLASPEISGADRARIARLAAILQDNQHAVESFRIAVDYYRAAGDEVRMCDALSGLAATYWRTGNYEECERLLLEVRRRMENGGDRRVLLKALGRLVTFYTTIGGERYDEALAILPELVHEMQEIGEVRQAAQFVKNLAAGAYFTGRYEDALNWAQKALELTALTSEFAMRVNLLTLCGAAEQERGNMAAATAWHLQACEAVPPLGECAEVAESFEDIAATLAALGSYAEAASLAGYAERLRTHFSSIINPDERIAYDRMLTRLHEGLGPRFPAAWAAGTGATLLDMHSLARRALEGFAGSQENEDTTSLS